MLWRCCIPCGYVWASWYTDGLGSSYWPIKCQFIERSCFNVMDHVFTDVCLMARYPLAYQFTLIRFCAQTSMDHDQWLNRCHLIPVSCLWATYYIFDTMFVPRKFLLLCNCAWIRNTTKMGPHNCNSPRMLHRNSAYYFCAIHCIFIDICVIWPGILSLAYVLDCCYCTIESAR